MDPSYNSKGNSIASDRLRKAIERNRRKREQKTGQSSYQSSFSGSPPHTQGQFNHQHQSSPPFSRPISPPSSSFSGPMSPPSPLPRPINPSPSPFSNPASSPSPFGRPPSSPINNWQKRTNTIPKKHGWFYKIITKIGWGVCLFLLIRLIFAERGMIDYYGRKKILTERNNILYRLKEDNKNIIKEIRKIKMDENFKKKIVRDRLGFISADEFLILFQKDSASPSTVE
ncbi:MAG: septum formation initiator family protein [Halobacteriovoraceae bacterium]|nr:septum formation initiator family protein [Halobacteriovoraceae bacterium]